MGGKVETKKIIRSWDIRQTFGTISFSAGTRKNIKAVDLNYYRSVYTPLATLGIPVIIGVFYGNNGTAYGGNVGTTSINLFNTDEATLISARSEQAVSNITVLMFYNVLQPEYVDDQRT